MTTKLPISALIVCCNESTYLKECIESISFCEEIVVVDLESTDNSFAIAREAGAITFEHKRVPISEKIREIYVSRLKFSWILLLDPDEIVTKELSNIVLENFNQISTHSDVSDVLVPWVFYFKDRKLRGTPWGLGRYKSLLVNRDLVNFVGLVHDGMQRHPFSRQLKIGSINNNQFIKHKWSNSWNQLIEKHLRYVRDEGESRYRKDPNPKLSTLIIAPFREFVYSFLYKKGFKDGVLGLSLSLFWVWYQTTAKFQHLYFARNQKLDSKKV